MSRKKYRANKTEENTRSNVLPVLLFSDREKPLHLWQRWYKLTLSRLGEKAKSFTEREIRLMLRLFVFIKIYDINKSPEQFLQYIREEDLLAHALMNLKDDEELPDTEKLTSFLASLRETGTDALILLDYNATSEEIEENNFHQQQIFE